MNAEFGREFAAEFRVHALKQLPLPIPAMVVLNMTSEDLDYLYATHGSDDYWRVLSDIVARITGSA